MRQDRAASLLIGFLDYESLMCKEFPHPMLEVDRRTSVLRASSLYSGRGGNEIAGRWGFLRSHAGAGRG
jgi:hypothetical protein